MRQVSTGTILFLSSIVMALAFAIFGINYFFYKYPGNNYFPDNIPFLVSVLILLNSGLHLYFPKENQLKKIGRELIYFFSIMCIIAFATNAVQLTPFPIIDPYLVLLEEKMKINMVSILAWTHNHPHFKYILSFIYDSLTYQMSILPLIVILFGKFHLIREFYFYLLCTVLIGFGFYYFFPTIAPASIIHSPYFLSEQMDTGLKFNQIHHHMIPTTNEGGLIALPSFHTIWAVLCVNLVREWPIICMLLLLNNILLIASCVLLGWHYVIDIIGGFIVLSISYFLLTIWTKNTKIRKS
ncbi:Uncharacterised protein [Legionella wadsworthii]|uniref:Inositolphosphotransferase Aur1/Ipt1 domain-containing protein n=1 Tax=Legionella wadsworthii TaxID=28088 RepID=A0A378LTQ2_9GAMM|nr:phosphatase PAP2 family protein [Legionella wadsworthii]STY29199.1 Uncharacterised protein [Legionella wadsworthii]